jgi:hypothetical protein
VLILALALSASGCADKEQNAGTNDATADANASSGLVEAPGAAAFDKDALTNGTAEGNGSFDMSVAVILENATLPSGKNEYFANVSITNNGNKTFRNNFIIGVFSPAGAFEEMIGMQRDGDTVFQPHETKYTFFESGNETEAMLANCTDERPPVFALIFMQKNGDRSYVYGICMSKIPHLSELAPGQKAAVNLTNIYPKTQEAQQ